MKDVIYKNGNCIVCLMKNGTRIISGDLYKLSFPNSIDLKITNKCDHGCSFCHESSYSSGKESDPDEILKVLEPITGNIELALGGGNPLSYSGLETLVTKLSNRGFIVNITVRDLDLLDNNSRKILLKIKDYISAIGVSITNGIKVEDYIDFLSSINENYVAHLIIGYNKLEDFDIISKNFPRILFLGYKYFGRGKSELPKNINNWKNYIKQLIYEGQDNILSFDNLAIEQINLKESVTDDIWKLYYQGDDISQSLYIDAVEGYFAKNSIEPKDKRISWKDINIIDYYDKFIKERRF